MCYGYYSGHLRNATGDVGELGYYSLHAPLPSHPYCFSDSYLLLYRYRNRIPASPVLLLRKKTYTATLIIMQDINIGNSLFRERLAFLINRKISQGAILDYLKGKREHKAEVLYRFFCAFSVTMEWLWGVDAVTPESETTAIQLPPQSSAREFLLESRLRMATSALEGIFKKLKRNKQ